MITLMGKFGEGEAGGSIPVKINPLEAVEGSSKELCKGSWLCSVDMNITAIDQLVRLMCLKRNLRRYSS